MNCMLEYLADDNMTIIMPWIQGDHVHIPRRLDLTSALSNAMSWESQQLPLLHMICNCMICPPESLLHNFDISKLNEDCSQVWLYYILSSSYAMLSPCMICPHLGRDVPLLSHTNLTRTLQIVNEWPSACLSQDRFLPFQICLCQTW